MLSPIRPIGMDEIQYRWFLRYYIYRKKLRLFALLWETRALAQVGNVIFGGKKRRIVCREKKEVFFSVMLMMSHASISRKMQHCAVAAGSRQVPTAGRQTGRAFNTPLSVQ